jgi:hypothetical protein
MSFRHTAMLHRLLIGSVPLWALIGCSGGDSGMNSSSMPASPPSTMLTADFESIQTNIFTPICAGCHGGANPAENLNLDAAHSYNDLVNVPSTEDPSLVRVKPGDPAHSFLAIHMQQDGDGAPLSDVPFVVQWIMDGAPPAASMPMAAQFRIAATEPNAGDMLHASPPRVVMGFTQELDAATLAAGAVRLERIDEAAGNPGATTVAATLSVPANNARALLLTPASALPPGQYQVVLDAASDLTSLGGTLFEPASETGAERILTRFSVAAE